MNAVTWPWVLPILLGALGIIACIHDAWSTGGYGPRRWRQEERRNEGDDE